MYIKTITGDMRMKRLLPFLLCMVITLTGCSVHLSDTSGRFSVNANAVTDKDTKTYLIMGDSIAAHYGVSERESYEHKLMERLRADGEKWVGDNWGVSGYTSGDLVTLLDKSVEDAARRAVIARANLIIISIGGNNILQFLRERGYNEFPPEEGSGWLSLIRAFSEGTDAMAQNYLSDLEVIMKEIRNVNPNAIVILQNIHNVARDVEGEISILGTPKRATDLTEPFFLPLLKTISGNAERLGYHVADTYGAFRDSKETPLLRREMIHPNAAGHTLISEVLYKTYRLAAEKQEPTDN